MSKFTTKQQFLEEITKERRKLETLLSSIPDERKTDEVTDGMSVKDFLAHRAEWGEMMIRWYEEARAGKVPAVPTERFKWNQLKELNADIHTRNQDKPLSEVTEHFNRVHDELYRLIGTVTEEELFTKKHYGFTGVSDLVTYLNSATASHYRSAAKHIRKWWKDAAG
jgi:hypothetical protein